MKRNIATIILGILVLIYMFILQTSCFAEDYKHEENQIRNKSKEYSAIVYYKDGEKIKTDYTEGKERSVKVPTGKALREAKELGADKVVFIHNHPSGTTRTSDADMKTKERVETKFENEGINTEHIVVTRTKERKY